MSDTGELVDSQFNKEVLDVIKRSAEVASDSSPMTGYDGVIVIFNRSNERGEAIMRMMFSDNLRLSERIGLLEIIKHDLVNMTSEPHEEDLEETT